MPLAKINYFPKEDEEGRTSVFLHYRMDRALRAITVRGKAEIARLQSALDEKTSAMIGVEKQLSLKIRVSQSAIQCSLL